jgi:hypothetical protein
MTEERRRRRKEEQVSMQREEVGPGSHGEFSSTNHRADLPEAVWDGGCGFFILFSAIFTAISAFPALIFGLASSSSAMYVVTRVCM